MNTLIDRYYLEPVQGGISVDEGFKLISHAADSIDSIIFKNNTNIHYDCDFGFNKHIPNQVPKTKTYEMIEEHKRFAENEPKNIVIAKRCRKDCYHSSIEEYSHLVNISYLFSVRRDFELSMQYFPANFEFYKYRHVISFQFQMDVLMNGLSTGVSRLACYLRTDNFVIALCEYQNISIDVKVKEVILHHLIRMRSHLISGNYSKYKRLIHERLNYEIIYSYNFVHHNPKRHRILCDIVEIAQGNDSDYCERQFMMALNRSPKRPNFADIIHYLAKSEKITDCMWKVLFENTDKIVALRKHKMGTTCLYNLFSKLDSSIKKKDARYQWLLQMRKLTVNHVYRWCDIKSSAQFYLKLHFKRETEDQCICCFEEFQERISYVVVCSSCNCSYCWKCSTRLIQHKKLSCAQCRQVGKIQQCLKMVGLQFFC